MMLSQFEDLLDKLGPSLGGWPSGAFESALDLLQASIPAQDAFIRATAYDVGHFTDSGMDFSSF